MGRALNSPKHPIITVRQNIHCLTGLVRRRSFYLRLFPSREPSLVGLGGGLVLVKLVGHQNAFLLPPPPFSKEKGKKNVFLTFPPELCDKKFFSH